MFRLSAACLSIPALGPRHGIRATCLVVPGAGHFPAVEVPEAFFAALTPSEVLWFDLA